MRIKVSCLILAADPVNSNDQGQNDLKDLDDTQFQSDKCLLKAIGNPTFQWLPTPASTISNKTVTAKGTRRDRNRTTLVGLDQFFKQRTAQETVALTDSSYTSVSETGTKSRDSDDDFINLRVYSTTNNTSEDKIVEVKDFHVLFKGDKKTPLMNKQEKAADDI